MVVTMLALLVLLVLVAGMLIYGVGLYNSLVEVRNDVDRAWADIDVLLKQRHDALTKLIDVVKGAKDFEQQTLQNVISARNGYAEAGNQLQALQGAQAEGSALRRLLAVAESYPDLKSSAAFQQLETEVSRLEESIADRREVYNASVNLCQTRFEQFPNSLFSGMLGAHHREFFQVDAGDRQDVAMKF
jgi:LemA protein